jgi:hypothetical protein
MRSSLSDCVTRLLHTLWQDLSPEASLQESPLLTPMHHFDALLILSIYTTTLSFLSGFNI